MGGGSGGGKSFGLRVLHVLAHLEAYQAGAPRPLSAIVCENFPKVRDRIANKFQLEYGPGGTIIPDLGKVVDSGLDGYSFQFNDPKLGAIWFRHFETEPDMFKGKELIMIGVDEVSEMQEKYLDESFVQRVRIGVRAKGVAHLPLVFTSNWDGAGLAWLRAMFYDRENMQGVDSHDVFFVPMLLDDNPDKEWTENYRPILEALSGQLRDSRLLGIPTMPSGAVFPMADPRVQGFDVVTEFPGGIPLEWTRIVGYDWGFAAPAAMLWHAIHPDGRKVYTYRERYQNRLTDPQQAQLLLDAMQAREYIDCIYADDQCWQSSIDNQTGIARPKIIDNLMHVWREDQRVRLVLPGKKGPQLDNISWLRAGLSHDPTAKWEWYIDHRCRWLWSELQNAVQGTTTKQNLECISDKSPDHLITAAFYSLRTHLDTQARPTKETVQEQLARIAQTVNLVDDIDTRRETAKRAIAQRRRLTL